MRCFMLKYCIASSKSSERSYVRYSSRWVVIVCLCVCVLQGPDQSTEVVRGPHCWRRTSGSHTAGAQGEAFALTHTQKRTINTDTSRDTKQTNLLPLAATPANLSPPPPPSAVNTSHHYSLFPSSIYYAACNFNQQKHTASGVGNPHHIIVMTHANMLSEKRISGFCNVVSPFSEYIRHQEKMLLC